MDHLKYHGILILIIKRRLLHIFVTKKDNKYFTFFFSFFCTAIYYNIYIQAYFLNYVKNN
ncbi:hypothetical protein PFUGPA_00706 [Plasmodium falciparum Palo Alto/Uganda]|uniref:Uncharacterized protein n=2 Tax=Plasmodium falciparum TaxID=5833 RepID=W4J4J0_PLAFP|nr:hypothetical protein PFNF135_01727 [Plasmodium falciparum NF135/5.C10]ETW57218.1 hypothetical protein PFUGPA_00706 [Plasmodium falciparum Palo Alto/Uganda]